MEKMVIGLMDNPRDAQAAVDELVTACGCARADIEVSARPEPAATAEHPGFFERLGGSIRGWVGGGVPEDEAHAYGEGVRRGGTLVNVRAKSDAVAECATRILQARGALDVSGRAEEWRKRGWSGRVAEAGEQVLPVAEEELVVGKRRVGEGAVRVYTRTKEEPVEESVTLREEHADIERRAVDRPVEPGDEAFREKSVEVSEMSEEPVVSKRARVTEEVRVGKRASEREEKVSDTVRKTEVEVEGGGGTAKPAAAAYRGPERRRASAGSYTGIERRGAGLARP